MPSTVRLLGHALLCALLCTAANAQKSKTKPLPAAPTAAPPAPKGIAFQRAAHLHRGINLSMWYAQASDFSDARIASFTTPDDFALIKKLGFDHVRLSINPEPLIRESQSGELRTEAIARLDHTVSDILAARLDLVLDIHPEEPYKHTLAQGDDSVSRFLAFWRTFATHFSNSDPDHVFFEILNEPTLSDLYRWSGIQARAVATIRAVAPKHTLIATAGEYSKVDQLLASEPVHDDNIIYTFHQYDPMWFTHQGANWGSQGWVFVRDVPYPSSPHAPLPNLDQEPDERTRLWLERYGAERWDASRLQMEINAAADWADRRHVPLWCGEFGVYRKFSDPHMRGAWITDVRLALEARHIGWAMWDYQGDFGIVTKADGKTTVDPILPTALGLIAEK